MELGDRVQQTREDQGKTQSDLAGEVGTSQSAISQIEAGDRNPTYKMIRKLARALNVTPGYLMGGDVKTENIDALSTQEEAHFRQYRGLSEEGRKELSQYIQYLQMREKQRRREDEDRQSDGDEP